MKMFFSRCGWRRGRRGRGLENQKLGRNQGVLYKNGDPSLLIALTLLLAVASGRLGVVLPVVLLIVGMSFAPLPAAVADHLGVLGVGLAFTASVVTAPPRLAFRPAAHRLIGTTWRRLKGLMAIRAAACPKNHFLRGLFAVQP